MEETKDNAKGFVTLVSSDGFEFIIERKHAMQSGTIQGMLSGPAQFSEDDRNEIPFREIPSNILERICTYLYYRVRYTNSSREIPDFTIPPEIALELLMASNFLDT
eukprot:m.337068 g.337068  ORF g.337068 m.337068 type:complete len:106 (+) comp18038_c0_seq1:53-370(+)